MNSNKFNYDEKYYEGSCETTFKKRFANHKKSFNNEQWKNETELSKEVWNLRSTNNKAETGCKIVRRCTPVNCAILRWNLCLKENSELAINQGINLLNKRSQLVSTCRYFNKLLLMNFEDNITWWQSTNVPFYCHRNPLVKLWCHCIVFMV